jgi:voltage-gated potassium channel
MKLRTTPRRAIERFLDDPASIRTAAWLILGTTVLVVLAGGVIMRLFDHREYPNFGRALWFTLETVTTVGYGDATPHQIVGRLVAAVVMVTGIGFITLVTACVTSMFVEASRQRGGNGGDAGETSGASPGPATATSPGPDVTVLTARLEQIERTLAVLVEQTRPG